MHRCITLAAITCCTLITGPGTAQKQPSDMRPNHPARQEVLQVLAHNVMDFTDGTNFRGEARVSRTQAVIAIAKLARAIENGQWKARPSVPLPAKAPTMQVVDTRQPVTRYTLATVLARLGNYLTNALSRPSGPGPDLARTDALPAPPRITVPASHPAHASLTYLASKRLIWPGSPLLKPDDKPLQSVELSRALAEMTTGLINQWTELGKDEEGNTPDRSFRNRK